MSDADATDGSRDVKHFLKPLEPIEALLSEIVAAAKMARAAARTNDSDRAERYYVLARAAYVDARMSEHAIRGTPEQLRRLAVEMNELRIALDAVSSAKTAASVEPSTQVANDPVANDESLSP